MRTNQQKTGNVIGHRSTIDLLVQVNQTICGSERNVEGSTSTTGVSFESEAPVLVGGGRTLFLVADGGWRGSCFLGCDTNNIGGYYIGWEEGGLWAAELVPERPSDWVG